MSQAVTDILVSRSLVSNDQVSAAQAAATSRGESVLRVLVQQGAVSKKDIVRATVEAAGLEFIEILDVPVEPAAVALVTGDQARKYGVMPLRVASNGALVVVSDSQTAADWQVREDLQAITGRPVEFACGVKAEVAGRINREYRAEAELGALMQDILDDQTIDILAPVAASTDAPLVRYVNLLLAQAIADKASDVHVEPSENSIRIRFRIDGVLKEMAPAPKEIQAAIISRIKIMSDMNIAERRVPQDGRLSVQHGGAKVDLRVSSIPTVWGEKIVMRILDNTTAMRSLGELGFSGDNLDRWRSAYSRPYGLLVVSGPTGSGKSTTLYATLHGVSNPEINIVTVEDPVEYRIPGINQVQVNVKAGLTFGAALRSILRADPDVILIGEIRDQETAQIAVESALTGHLVLTTLHTNDSASVVTRLTEMGMEPYLVSSALTCASGQRLARRLCDKCKKPASKNRLELDAVGFDVPSSIERTFFDPVGCPACAHTGFSGRVGLHEVMPSSEALAALTLRNASSAEIQAQAVLEGMRTLRQDGWLKVAQGLTTVPEVLRVIA